MTELLLTAGDRQSATWLKLEAHLKERLEHYRIQNDSEVLDVAATAKLRGRIAQLKALIELGKST